MVAGIIVSLLIALVFDLAIVAIGKLLMPWNRPTPSERQRRVRKTLPVLGGDR